MRSSRPGMKSASMPSLRSVSSRTKVQYASTSSVAVIRHSSCCQTSSAWVKRYTCSLTPSSWIPRSAATSR